MVEAMYHGFTMFESFDNRRFRIFWDNVRLETAKSFTTAFTKALFSSQVVMPFISTETLDTLSKNCTSGPACWMEPDNVLLEWWLSIIFLETREKQSGGGSRSCVTHIYPVLCLSDGDEVDTPEHYAAAKKAIFQKVFSKEIHGPTKERLIELLKCVQLKVSGDLLRLSVHDIVKRVLGIQTDIISFPPKVIASVDTWSRYVLCAVMLFVMIALSNN